jgi:hypothetical protein
MTKEDCNDLAIASKSSLHFYERIRHVRGARAMIANGTLSDVFLGTEVGDLPELEATFLRSGEEMRKLLERNPDDADVAQVYASHEDRRANLEL